VYPPLVTLRAFLWQVLAGSAGTCQAAVSRILVERLARRQSEISPDCSSYCEARQRLPEETLAQLARERGQLTREEAPPQWRWKGRQVVLVDGSTAEMPDTPQNQAEYPQSTGQGPGLGFPMLRFVVLISLSVGTVLECAMGACRGKCTGEQNLFRRLWDALQPGDLVLGDSLFDAYRDIALLQGRGIDVLLGKKSSRQVDFRRGRSLGHDDHLVMWHRPAWSSQRFSQRADWTSLPEVLEMREIRRTLQRPGFRNRTLIVVTTLLDAVANTAEEIIELFGQRWHCELDLRSIKQSLGLARLKCKTPSMVRRELWTSLLAYNLVRARMAQAAFVHAVLPRGLSFTAAQRHLSEFGRQLTGISETLARHLHHFELKAIAGHLVGNRPGRIEPRAIKKRRGKYPVLTLPRAQARQQLKLRH
jgi:hypothetical protein